MLLTGKNSAANVTGYTLVEMLVVLTIFGMVAGSISFVVINKQETLQSKGREVVQHMQLTQLRAVREGQSYQVRFDLESNSIDFPDQVINLPQDYSLTVRTSRDQLLDNHVAGMSFHADASSSGGYVLLESAQERFEIDVVWISGKVLSKMTRKEI